MSYEAKVFNVMIASPGDVASERTIIRDVIYEWNAVHSKSRNIVLLPVGGNLIHLQKWARLLKKL